MMYDQLINFVNRAPGATAVLTIPPNRTVDKIHLRLPAGVTKSQIGSIIGKVNDRTFFVDSGANITIRDAYMNGVNGYVDPQIITIDFTEPNARGGAPEVYLTCLPVNLMGKVTFEIGFDLSITAPQAAQITADCEYRGPTGNPFIMRRRDYTQALPVNGDNDILLPSAKSGALIKRVWVHHTGNVQKLELRGDNATKFRFDTAALSYMEKRAGFVPQSNVAVIDFVASGNIAQAFNTKSYTESLLRITTTGADTAKIFVDFVDHFNLV